MNYLTDTTHEQRKATVAFIRWHRAFIRGKMPLARIPGNQWGDTMTQIEAQRFLSDMVERAINGKADLTWPKNADREHEIAYRRDQWRIQDRIQRRVIVRQFETKVVQQRFSHLLTTQEDE